MSRTQIIIIEDDLIIASEIKAMMEKLKYKVISIETSGEEAIKKIEQTKPNLVIVDINLKGQMNGIDATHQINNQFDIPVIYITTRIDEKTSQLIKTTKFYGYLRKPIGECELFATIEIALNKYKAEKKLRESREWLSIILKSIADGIITTDIKGYITFINPVAEQLTGWKDEDAVGMLIDNVLSVHNEQGKIKTPIEVILNEQKNLEILHNATLTSKNGFMRIINESGAPIRNNEGDIIGTVIILHDITEEIKSQKALRESEELHRITLNSISDAVFITKDDGDFIYICPNAEVIFGYTEYEIKELKNISKILGKDMFGLSELRKSREITNIERKIKNKNGRIVDILVNVKQVSISDGTILYTCHDITELKKAQDKISRLNRMYSLLSELNEAIVRIRDNRRLFDEVCRIAIERGSFKLAWIGIIDYEEQLVKPISYSGFNDGYIDKIKISIREDIPEGKGPTGTAIRTGKYIICNNIENTDMTVRKDEAIKRGYRSSATFPLWIGKEIIGVLKVYASEEDFFDSEEICLLERLVEDISLALTSIEYEKYLEREKKIASIDIIEKEIVNDMKTKFLKTNSDEHKYKDKQFSSIMIPPKIIDRDLTIHHIITQNKKFKEQLSYLPEIAESDLTTLIYGESGTGKELVAMAIKNLSKRKTQPFLVVNCAALPDNLLESELFGYVKGAFTGAISNKIGLFQSANGGTIFLDEIGDISQNMQVKILRTLQEKEIIPVGSVKKLKIDTRFICATNKNLSKMVAEEKFREDLYYRLNVLTINLPSLRERIDDIPLLINHFIQIFNKQIGRDIENVDNEVLRILMSYNYPGNIRELENIIKQAFIFCKGKQITISHLPKYLFNNQEKTNPLNESISKKEDRTSYDIDEKEFIINELQKNKWNIKTTAESLKIHRATLWRKMKKLGIR